MELVHTERTEYELVDIESKHYNEYTCDGSETQSNCQKCWMCVRKTVKTILDSILIPHFGNISAFTIIAIVKTIEIWNLSFTHSLVKSFIIQVTFE